MKRRLTKLVVFVLLGAVVNVAVAWGCACWSDLGEARYTDKQVNVMISFGYTQWVSVNTINGERWTLFWPASAEAGWPLRCVVREGHFTEFFGGDPRIKGPRRSPLNHGWDIREVLPWFPRKAGRLLPLRPIWPGFAIDTIFYAVLLWCVTLGPFAARRFIRDKRGLCIKCGYDLRGAEHEACPECGAQTR